MTWLFSPCSKWGNRGLEWWMLERITAELVVPTTALCPTAQQALLVTCPFIGLRLVSSYFLSPERSAFVRLAVKITLCPLPVAVFWAQPAWPVLACAVSRQVPSTVPGRVVTALLRLRVTSGLALPPQLHWCSRSCVPLEVGRLSLLCLFDSYQFCTSQLLVHLFYEGLCNGS